MLGTSNTWSTSHLSQLTSVLYCRLPDFKSVSLFDQIRNTINFEPKLATPAIVGCGGSPAI